MSKKFNGTNMKDAYMKAVKWYATNVLAKNELQEVTCSYEKDNSQKICPADRKGGRQCPEGPGGLYRR